MPEDRLLRILTRLAGDAHGKPSTTRLCVVCAEITEMTGAGIMLMVDEHPQGSVCTTNDVSATIEDLQYTLGEGPCVDAFRHNQPVVEPDLADPAVTRWTAFSEGAVAAGARAVFGFPVMVGDIPLGALNLYRDRPGAMSAAQHADALLVAAVAGRSILRMQAGAEPGAIGAELEVGTNFRFAVHQAAGMIAVQLGVGVDVALVRLRAYAFSHDRNLIDVAHDVIDRRLRFDDEDTGDAP